MDPTPPRRDRPTLRALSEWWVRTLGEGPFLIFLAVLTGATAGLGAVGFSRLIDAISEMLLTDLGQTLGPYYLLPLIPAMGGLVVGFIVHRWAREARGHGVPEVIAAVATEGGRIRPRVALVKILASAVCIGSGGSAGREGPIIQIGSAIGSTLGQIIGSSPQRMRILVGCGAAAGISATFNAPLAGVVFSLEVILGDFSIAAFSPIIISAVMATALARSFEGDGAAFLVPHYQSGGPHELVLFSLLGVIAAFAAVAFTRLLYMAEDRFDAAPLHPYVKPALGGLLVGVIGLYLPQVFGVGYHTITEALLNEIDMTLLALLLGAKLVATCLTLGSGGSGGVFAPSLFLGAMIGAMFGNTAQMLTGVELQPGAYALVGMAAVVAGTTHAPLTALLILFEMTDDYKLILPLMLATTISTLVSKWVMPESIYMLKLSRRGLHLEQGVDVSLLETLKVKEVCTQRFDIVGHRMPLRDIVHLLSQSDINDFPVVDDAGHLCGMVDFDDIRPVMVDQGSLHLIIAADIMSGDPPSIDESANLRQALNLLAERDVETLPVVRDGDHSTVVGVITRSALLTHYHSELQRRMSS